MNMPPNLNAEDRDLESSVYAVTLAGVLAYDHGASWHHYDESFVGRNYFRVVEPKGACSGVRHDGGVGQAPSVAAKAAR